MAELKSRSNSFDQIPVRINENIVLTANVSKSNPETRSSKRKPLSHNVLIGL